MNSTVKSKSPLVHLAYLDGLRAVAALYVVLHHVIVQFDLSKESSTFLKVFSRPFLYGHYAVDLFIVLSGFCLMLPVVRNKGFLRGGIVRFFKSRTKRILPPYYVALLLSLILIFTIIGTKTGTLWDWSLPVTNWDIFSHILLISDVFENTAGKINYSFWSISVEWRIYFLFPLLVILYRKIGALETTILLIALSIVAVIGLSATTLNTKDYGINPQYVGLFGLGMLSAYVSFSSDNKAKQLKSMLGWETIIMLFLISIPLLFVGKYLKSRKIIDDDFPIRDIIFGLCLYAILAWIAIGKLSIVRQVLSWKPLVFVGAFAYSIYLIHAPLIQVIWQYILEPLNISLVLSIGLLLVAGTAVIVALSYLFFLVAERPFINKQPNKLKDPEMVFRNELSDVNNQAIAE
ncbi:MAG: acyltransferase [Pyrinomonadaceae bacterium]|nr:acyltransferase [Sphingobacteriaceae bacterium]